MALAALVLTCDDDEPASIRPAELQIAGQSLFAYQIRMAHAAGASHIVALVDQMPASLAVALDRLREEGISVDIARDARDAADRIHPEEALIVLARGMVVTSETVASLAQKSKPALMCVRGQGQQNGFERIDADWQWTGLALLNGAMLRETAAMVGDWVLGPTLLRHAVQCGAERLELEEGRNGLVAFPQSQAEADQFARQLAASGTLPANGWVARVYHRILARISPLLVRFSVPAEILSWVPAVLLGLSAALAIAGWLATAMILFLLAPLIAGHARLLERIGGRRFSAVDIYDKARLPIMFVLIVLVGWEQTLLPASWGPLVLGLWASVGIALVHSAQATMRDWYPEPEGAVFIALFGLAIGYPVAALALLVVHGLVAQIARIRNAAG